MTNLDTFHYITLMTRGICLSKNLSLKLWLMLLVHGREFLLPRRLLSALRAPWLLNIAFFTFEQSIIFHPPTYEMVSHSHQTSPDYSLPRGLNFALPFTILCNVFKRKNVCFSLWHASMIVFLIYMHRWFSCHLLVLLTSILVTMWCSMSGTFICHVCDMCM